MKNNLLEIFAKFEHFCKILIDPYVVLDKKGNIVRSNEAFGNLVKKNRKLNISINDVLILKKNDNRMNISDFLKYKTPYRFDDITGIILNKDKFNLIITTYPIYLKNNILGIFFLIRDITSEINLRNKYEQEAIKSITDGLTGLYNRSYFDQYLSDISNAQKYHKRESDQMESVFFLVMDIDYFKSINDTYGHQAGDYILKSIAENMRKSVRKTDVVCRYGGEEFIAIINTPSFKGSYMAAEKLRQNIEKKKYEYNNITIKVTISCGIAKFKNAYEPPEDVIERADIALYKAKESGRNRICINNGSIVKVIESKDTFILLK